MDNSRNILRIYLDTNHWIELSRIAKGKNDDPVCKKLYSELLELSNSGKILIPFSSFNFFEIVKNNNDLQREQMIDFMVDTSNGWYFKPINRYLKYEIANACWKKLGQIKHYNISSLILTNRADSIINGGVGQVAPREGHNPTKDMQEKAQKKWDDAMKNITHMKNMFKQPELRTFSKTDVSFIDIITNKIENSRTNSFGVSDVIFDNYTKIKYIVEFLLDDFARFFYENKISPQKFIQNKSEFVALIQDMPALNVFVELSYVRDKESIERSVKRNDYYDIWHHATGLSYADIMVGEKMFGSISKRQKLDQKNNCELFSSLKELAEFNISSYLRDFDKS